MASNVTAANLNWGPGNIYLAPFGTTLPTAANTTPAAPFVSVGGTNGGVKFTFMQNWGQLDVDQILWDHIESRLTSNGVTVETSLAELTQANLKWALNGGVVSATAATSTYTASQVTPGSAPTYVAMIIDSPAPNGFNRRFMAPKVLSTDNVEQESKKDDQALWTVTFTPHWVSDSVAPFTILDQLS